MRFALLFLLAFAIPLRAEPPKNVIFLIADDLGSEVGCYGDPLAKTPNIDALAKAGTRFTHAFASVSSCSPSRATMLTGLPSHQCGQYGLAHATHHFQSFDKTKSIPGILNLAGYKTAVIAKLHVSPKEVYPFQQELGGRIDRDVEAMAAIAKKFIQECNGKPFFLHVGFHDPHRAAKGFGNESKMPATIPKTVFDPKAIKVPFFLPDHPEVRADLADYYESVARLDYGIGLMRKVLEETNVADNTLIVFLSDNGIPFPGAKTTLYDPGVRLPLIALKPGQKPGIVNDMLVSFTDLAPTVLDWCGLSKPDAMLGHSFLLYLEQEPQEGWQEVFGSHQFHEVTMYYPMRMVRTAKYKLILNLAHDLEYPTASDLWGSPSWQSVLYHKDVMLGERSTSAYLHRPKEELFDLAKDPHELKNRIDDADFANVRDQLRAKLATWRKATNDPWLIKDLHE